LQTACLIAVSGYGTPADVRAAYAAGFDHHFIKPVAMDDLLTVLRGIGGRAQ
jgi:CheY-like chemotaxis protein